MKTFPVNKNGLIGAALAAAAFSLPLSMPAFAESAPEKGLVAFKYLNYQDSQPGQDRIGVNAYSVRGLVPIAGKWAVDITGTYDSVSGASPHYHTYIDAASGASGSDGKSGMEDTRRAIDMSVTRYFGSGSITMGMSYSEESDYISRNYSISGNYSTPDKNTTFTLGTSMTTDTITPNNFDLTDNKKINSYLAGITRVLSSTDIVQFNIGRTIGHGYFNDPYKVNDERPGKRNVTTLLSRWNHYFDSTEGASHLSYRYYSDSFGIRSHTVEAEYVHPLPSNFTITPALRLYSQNEADFYVPVGPDELLDPTYATPPPADARYYSEDQRLSAFGAMTLGLKVEKRIAEDWVVDVRYDHYMQRSDWAISGTKDKALADFNADFFQVGISMEF